MGKENQIVSEGKESYKRVSCKQAVLVDPNEICNSTDVQKVDVVYTVKEKISNSVSAKEITSLIDS